MNPAGPSTWPPELDALKAAPEHHALVFENEQVRVLETRIPAGETTRLHTHCWPAVLHIITRSDSVRRDERGNVMFDSRQNAAAQPAVPANTVWSEPLSPHTLENVGDSEVRVVSVEIKQR